MADITINGQEITFNLNNITRNEYKALFLPDSQNSEAEANKILAKTCELEAEQIGELGLLDWRTFMKAFWKKAGEPLQDPNA